MSRTKSLMMACAIMVVAHTANAQTPPPPDPTKPIERENGSLDFQKMSDRQVSEFMATHIYLLNRQIMSMNSALLMSMNNSKSLNRNESMTMMSQNLEMTGVFLRSINGWAPDDPKAREALNKMLQLNPVPNK